MQIDRKAFARETIIGVDATDTGLRIRAGTSTTDLSMVPVDLPTEETDPDTKPYLLSPEFGPELKLIATVCATDMSRPQLTCVHLAGDWIEGSDSYRMVRVRSPVKLPDMLLPASSAILIARYDIKQMLVSAEWAHFATDDGTTISSRFLTGRYPDLSEQYEFAGTDFVLPERLTMVIGRAGVLARRDSRIDEEIEVRLRKGGILITAQDRNERFKERVPWDNTEVTATFTIHPSFFKLALENGTRCRLNSSRTRIRFTGLTEDGNEWQHLIAFR
jgi:hypothetical protein